MNNFREVNDDILRDWLSFREEMVLGTLTKEDRKHYIYFDEITENILKNVPKQNQKYVKNQLDRLDKNFMDYICYWNEKYYRNGFCDGVELIIGCIDKLSELTVKVGMWVSYEDITNEYMNSGFVGTMKVYIESK